MNASIAPNAVGVIGLPEVADVFARIGLDPVTGEDYRAAATQIRAGLDAGAPFPILVIDTPWPGIRAWVEKAARETDVAVLHGANGNGTQFSGPVSVALPAPVDDVLRAIGFEPNGSTTGMFVDVEGHVITSMTDPVEEPPTAPVIEEPVAEPAPISVEAPPVAVAPVAEVDDPWEDDTPAEPIEPVTFEAPPVQAPAAPVIEEPAPISVEAPPVAVAPVAEVDDPWEDDTPVEPIEPVTFEAPPVQAPAAPVIEEPVAEPVVFEAPAPAAPELHQEQPVGQHHRDVRAVPTADPTQERVDVDPISHTGPVDVPPIETHAVETPTHDEVHIEAPVVFEAPPAPTEVPATIDEPAGATSPMMARSITPAPDGPGLGKVVLVWAGKGGVGKSTTAFSLAQRASKAGLRVILVDANLGQGDMRTFLRIGSAGLPSIYQAALSGEMKQALIDPDTLNTTRSPKLDPLGFALVQAPPPRLADNDVVTPEVYLNVVEQAREVCDLVILDTQIIEPGKFNSAPMVSRLVAPLLRAGAWGVGISDLSSAGIANLLTNLKAFHAAGTSRDRAITMLNRIPDVDFNRDGVASAFNEHSTFIGIGHEDSTVPEAMNRGRAVSNNPTLAPLLDAALNRITGMEEFSPNATAAAQAASAMRPESVGKSKGGGFLSRLRRKAS